MGVKMHQFNIGGYDIHYKTVGRGNASSGRVNLPVSWVGREVAVVLLEKIENEVK